MFKKLFKGRPAEPLVGKARMKYMIGDKERTLSLGIGFAHSVDQIYARAADEDTCFGGGMFAIFAGLENRDPLTLYNFLVAACSSDDYPPPTMKEVEDFLAGMSAKEVDGLYQNFMIALERNSIMGPQVRWYRVTLGAKMKQIMRLEDTTIS